MNCLQGFKEESSRNEHIGYCKNNELVRIEMPHKRDQSCNTQMDNSNSRFHS